MIPFDIFKQVELRVGKILSAERVEGSEKLLKILVEMGSGIESDSPRSSSGGAGTRQIISGIGKTYTPESLEGKMIVLVANLEPRTLMGLESHGMLLAATDEAGTLALLTVDRPVLPGAKVS